MTRYLSDINLKSSVYNQNGQNYFEQVRAYNSMSSHLRRTLLAKCTVDTRNQNYMSKRKQLLKQSDYKLRSVSEITNDVIDTLAYDTQHSPAEFLKVRCDSRYLYQRKGEKYFTDSSDYDVISSRSKLKNHASGSDFFTFQTNKSEPFISNGPQTKQRMKKEFRIENNPKYRYEDSIIYESDPDYSTQENLSMAVNSSKNLCDNYKNYETTQLFTITIANRKVRIEDEETKYAKFVYEITNEIMENGFYTNEEFGKVFKKHLEKNEKLLDMNRMLYEISQLKVALSIDDLGDDELKDFRTLNSVVQPPPPPLPPLKVLNEKTVLKKTVLHRKTANTARSCNEKSVLLKDANPELCITEREILTSLKEANVAPDQVQKIYEKLFAKSKDIPTYLDVETTERSNDESTPIEHNFNELEKGSTTSDLISYEEKGVQAYHKRD